MEIVEKNLDEITVLKLTGRLDASSAPEMKSRVLELIDAGKIKVLIEMNGIDFIDSSGLGILVSCLRLIDKAGGALKIASLKENPKNLFQTTRLNRVFELFEDPESALKTF
jgi:anti-sigma B factor antagonist